MLIENSLLCEIKFDLAYSNGSEVKFSENQRISSVDFANKYLIHGLFVHDTSSMTKSPSGRPIIAANTGLAMTLMVGQKEKIYNAPVNQYNTIVNGGFYYEFTPFQINYPTSFLRVLDNTSLAIGSSFCFSLLYREKARR